MKSTIFLNSSSKNTMSIFQILLITVEIIVCMYVLFYVQLKFTFDPKQLGRELGVQYDMIDDFNFVALDITKNKYRMFRYNIKLKQSTELGKVPIKDYTRYRYDIKKQKFVSRKIAEKLTITKKNNDSSSSGVIAKYGIRSKEIQFTPFLISDDLKSMYLKHNCILGEPTAPITYEEYYLRHNLTALTNSNRPPNTIMPNAYWECKDNQPIRIIYHNPTPTTTTSTPTRKRRSITTTTTSNTTAAILSESYCTDKINGHRFFAINTTIQLKLLKRFTIANVSMDKFTDTIVLIIIQMLMYVLALNAMVNCTMIFQYLIQYNNNILSG